MSYQVLARKWRPKSFSELMGQEHVVTVLVNALTQQRLHHAYLFTGTRGVGKTTIARIFAKSLNCEQGVTATPCGICDACVDIDAGRFVDLLEIDAASKTKVDDTREILDNVQYSPTRGRYKVYLIDEVHMLSRSSFNALLKTLEEPPEHVKFILATTDPQKLPVTVLSRCLQFHLKALTVKQISEKITEILHAENVNVDEDAIALLAKAARGSMRDCLSLTDQSIAQGNGAISRNDVQQMLGGVDKDWVYKIVIALLKQDSKGLMQLSLEIASYAPSYSRLSAELLQLLHQVAMAQIVDSHFGLSTEYQKMLTRFCQLMSPEDVQLYYQIVLNARKDLPYADDEQAAFDMMLLRLLAFKPVVNSQHLVNNNVNDGMAESSNDKEIGSAFDDVTFSSPTQDQENSADSRKVVSDEATQSSDEVSEFTDEVSAFTDEVSEFTDEVSMIFDNAKPETVDKQVLEQEVTPLAEQSVELVSDNSSINATTSQTEEHHEITASAELSHATDTLNQEMLAIEQQAKKFTEDSTSPYVDNNNLDSTNADNSNTDNGSVTSQLTGNMATEDIKQNVDREPNQQPSFESPVAAAIATRNMLRSRKKSLENSEKKSNGAPKRQESAMVEKGITETNTETDKALGTTINNEPMTTDSRSVSVTSSASATSAGSVNINQISVPDISTLPEQPYHQDVIDPATIKLANQVDMWAHMIDSMSLAARLRQLAIHATIDEASTDDLLILKLDQSIKHLNSDAAHKQLEQRISEYLQRKVTVELNIVEKTIADPYQIQSDINSKRYEYAKQVLAEDDIVIALQEQFQAKIDQNTIVAR